MNIYSGDNFVEVRLEPSSKKNRVKIDLTARETGVAGTAKSLVEHLNKREEIILSKNMVERRYSNVGSIRLEYIFWRISNDRFVKDK